MTYAGGDAKKPLSSLDGALYTGLVVVLIFVCCAESVAFSVYNKWLFSGPLKAPVFVTAMCQAWCFLGALLVWLLSPKSFYTRSPVTSAAQALKILIIPVAFVANYGMNNLSLKYTTLALNQLIRSFSPVAIAVTSYLIEGKVQSLPKAVTLVCLVGGVLMGVGTSPDFELLGVLICAGSLLGQALNIVMTALVMGDMKDSVKLSPFDVLFYTALPSVAILLPFSAAIGEYAVLVKALEDEGFARLAILVFGGGIFAFTYTLFYVLLIKITSSVYYGVTGGFRCTVAIIISFYFFPQKITALSILGIVIAMTAFIANSYFTMKEKLSKKYGGVPANQMPKEPQERLLKEAEKEMMKNI
mmetsp:Transcript_8955/g.22040  ORF Transcript_8955/g.22040 Transcript_8955/m.22040 type:complete len:358 (-) Transcript_8955:407-1480(-)|eukprot:CAMPEP_0114523240 /NCGR_PEP_ID=MMETSP0109-20121206/21186_1 /TAXON_ID=29199 /ORGANISM="Chlorarachnion reptans, Strain CCCM449" /LENGTH=357 /DNA_ID=CAMNT_0001704543 /DNA_START=155 /DNA_END=1228 /DNA_ORIENTATION=-